ncbi:hypothetical protein ACP70R_002667 [Stipagrostis hirtigluma subsp. patula]
MEAKLVVIFAAFLLLCTCSTGLASDSECSLSSILVAQTVTGEWAHGQPVYGVIVANTCRCAQSDLKVACGGFNTTLAVDPSKLRPVDGGDLCLVNDGAPVVIDRDVIFSYAWSEKFRFRPVSSTVACKY